jgi:hypothetical protein
LKILKLLTIESKAEKIVVGIIIGTVIFLCSLRPTAPSSLAASKIELSMQVNAAVIRIMQIPLFFQMNSRYKGAALFTLPKIVAQIKAALAVGITIGSTNAVRSACIFFMPKESASEIKIDNKINAGTAIIINKRLLCNAKLKNSF